jgi:hypothetical protein
VDDVYDAMKRMRGEWKTAFDDIKAKDVAGFRVPQNIADAIRAGNPTGDIKIPQFGKLHKVEDLMDYQQAVQQLSEKVPGKILTRGQKKIYQNEANRVDRMLQQRLSRHTNAAGENLGEKFAKNKDAWNVYKKLEQMAARKGSGQFTMQDAERVIAKSRNATPEMRDFANAASRSLSKFPSNPGPFQTAAALGMLGIGAGGGAYAGGEDASIGDRALGGTLGVLGVLGAGKGLSSKTVQKMLAQYGEQGLLDRLAPALRRFGSAGRRGVVAGQEEYL